MMGAALPIRADLTTEALRRHARGEPNRRAALRLLAIANALEGVSRAEAARLAGMERQALRDAVVRYNAEGIAGLCRGHRGAVPRASRGCAEGIAGLYDRPKPGRPPRLSEAEQAALMARVFRGPDPERDGVSAWTRADLCGWLGTRFGKPFHPSSLSRVLRRLALSRQKTRPVHPQADPKAQERFRKRGCATL
jgi:transposase